MENQEILNQIKTLHQEMKGVYDQQFAEIKANGFVSPELKSKFEKMEADQNQLISRVTSLEQKGIKPMGSDKIETKSAGAQFVESDSFRQMAEGKSRNAIAEVKATFTSPSMVAPQMAAPVGANIFAYKLRSYLPTIPVQSDVYKVPQETAYTNNAGPKAYGATGNESTLTITMVDANVRTISHYTNVAKELLVDSTAFAAFVDSRMTWGLQGAEEGQLLIGDGTGNNIKGLVTYATSKTFTTESMIDRIGLSIGDVLKTGHAPSFVVLNPADYATIMTAKASTAGTYLLGNPAFGFSPTIWGVAVLPSSKLTANNFLVGASSAAAVAERQGAVVSLSFENASNFTSGIVTVQAEQRETLAVYAPGAFVTGLLS
jgi:HK97 family phage major capsid protein